MQDLPDKSYARSCGAKCDECPLRDQPTYVNGGSSRRGNQRLVLLGDAPTVAECDAKSPFLGAKKYYIKRACDAASIRPNEVYTAYTVACSLPAHIRPKQILQAAEACSGFRVHLVNLLGPSNPVRVITSLGTTPLTALTGKTSSTAWRGYPLEGIGEWEGYTVFPTIGYASILAEPAMEMILHEDFKRIKALLGTISVPEFDWPLTHCGHEGEDKLLDRARASTISVDIETNSLNHLDAEITCIGIGFDDECYSIRFPFTDSRVEDAVLSLLSDESVGKVFHNALYDLPILAKHNLIVKGDIHDTLVLHHTLYPTLPHDLGFVASQCFNAPRWKSFAQSSFDEHQLYNARDAYFTLKVYHELNKRLDKHHNGRSLYNSQRELLPIAIEMQRAGVRVAETTMLAHKQALTLISDKSKVLFASELTSVGLDPEQFPLGRNGSTGAVKKLFFETLKVPSIATTDSGQPKLDEAVLQKLIADGPTPISRTLAKALLDYRKPNKLISTYVDGLSARNGKVHPTWKTTGTITGRWASSEPNLQNLPKLMRNIFIPEDGNVIASSDYSALELRLIALLSGESILLEAFHSGADVHRTTASLMFGKAKEDITDAERNLSKTFTYLSVYGGGAEKLRESLIEKGFVFSIQETQALLVKFQAAYPGLKIYQRKLLATAYNDYYVEEPWSGRRQYFYGGKVNPNKVLNYPCQAAAATMMNKAVLKMSSMFNKNEKLLAQVHDAAYIEGPDPVRLKKILSESMTERLTLNGHTLDFPVDFGYGPNMRDTKLK